MNSPKTEPIEVKNEEKKQISTRISEIPEFAEICCFINYFGEKLGVILTFPRIASILSCETDADLQSLTTLLVKLLNKMHLRTQLNRWQPALGRFLQRQAYNCDELRSIGDALNNGSPPTLFFSLPPEKRLRVLLFCLETQFQLNAPFKEKVKSMDTLMLRTPPLGIDIFGNSYWLFVDNECHFLLYRAEAVDMTLELLGDTFPALEAVITNLKDDKFKKTPISELYAVFRGSVAKAEPPETILSSPQHIPSPLPPSLPEEPKVVEPMVSLVKEEVPEQSEEKHIDVVRNAVITEKTGTEMDSKDTTTEEQLPEKEVTSEAVTAEQVRPHETSEKQEPSEDTTKVGSQIETPGLRRSSRKRKQVEFLSMESFHTSKTRSKKSVQYNPIPKKEKKSKKTKPHKDKSSKKRCKLKNKKHRNGHNGNGGFLWARSPEDSESDNDEDEDLWAEGGSNFGDNADSSLPENEKQLPHDWLEDIESDFDVEGDGNDTDVVAGRNLQRQKAQVLDEAPCQICTISDHPEWLLLCDSCDLGYHAQCLRPALHYIPPGDWFCPRCLHSRLVTALSDQLASLQIKSKKLDSAARMQERLNFVNISVSNILRDERTRLSAAVNSESSSSYSSSSSEGGEITRKPRQKRQRYHESEVSSSDGSTSDSEEDSEGSDEDDEQEDEEEELSVRSTRHRKIHYDVNAAFQKLDEVLVEDEKYAQEKMERSKSKGVHATGVEENKEDEENNVPGKPAMPPSSVISHIKRKGHLSSSSSDASGSEGMGRRKRRKRLSSGSEEFRPSDESITDEDDSEFGEVEEESGENASESPTSSDQSWKVSRRNKRRGRRSKRRSKHRRSGRTSNWRQRGRHIPRFEGPSGVEDDDDEMPLRRSARIRVNYREIDSSEEEEEEVKKKPSSRRGRGISSGSEYAPSQEEEAEAVAADEEEEGDVEEEEEVEQEEDGEDENKKDEEIANQERAQPKIADFPTSEVRDIPQALTADFPITAELELDENELQIDEDLMSVKEDDPIFQNFLIDDINLPINQDPSDDVDAM